MQSLNWKFQLPLLVIIFSPVNLFILHIFRSPYPQVYPSHQEGFVVLGQEEGHPNTSAQWLKTAVSFFKLSLRPKRSEVLDKTLFCKKKKQIYSSLLFFGKHLEQNFYGVFLFCCRWEEFRKKNSHWSHFWSPGAVTLVETTTCLKNWSWR